MVFHDFSRLLRPRSIAVMGSGFAHAVIRECDRMGFDGQIWPIHPTRDAMSGHKCFRSLADLPSAPDATFIGVNRHATIDVLAELSAMGAGGGVCFASGFRETGPEGDDLQARLVAASGTMPVLGPNCYGFINYFDGALLWPDFHGGQRVDRGVAIITQSSNIAINMTMNRRALPIGYVIALGNQAKVGLADAVMTAAADDRVSAIGLHIEGIADAAALTEAVAFARSRGKAIVALKTGTSEAGAAITMTHTASMAGSAKVTAAFFARIGMASVESIPAFLETLKLLHLGGMGQQGGVASMSCSGGEAALMSDTFARFGLPLHQFTPEHEAAIRATVHPLVAVSNPFDYHTFDWGNAERLTATFTAVLASGPAMTLLLLDWPKVELGTAVDWEKAAQALIDAAKATGRRAGVLATLPECLPEPAAAHLIAHGVVPFYGIEEALAAIRAARFVAEPVGPAPLIPATRPGTPRTLLEAEAKARLAAAGLTIPAANLTRTVDAAVAVARTIGFPVVAKASGGDLTHKTELGGVVLNLRDEAALRAAFDRLIGLGEAVLVEQMVADSVAELIVGVARDPVFGPHLILGAGGILAELLADTALLLLPASRDDIAKALKSLKIMKLIAGWRGKPAGDFEAAVSAIAAIADFAVAHAETLIELDVNPLIVRPQGHGAVAVDALISLIEDMI